MTMVKLNRIFWFKRHSKDGDINRKCSFTYYVDGFGEYSFDVDLPIGLGEEIDAFGQKMLWEKIKEIKQETK